MKRKGKEKASKENKKCCKCNQNNHQRSSSKLCPERTVRKGKEQAENTLREFSVFKQGLSKFCREEDLYLKIQDQVRTATENAFHASRILNLHLQKLIEMQEQLPNILNPTWIRQLFTKKIKDRKLGKTIQSYPAFQFRNLNGQITSYLIKEFIVNLQLHISKTWMNLKRRWVKEEARSAGIVDTGALKQAVYNGMLNVVVPTDLNSIVQDIYHWNFVFMRYGGKQFNLSPQYTTKAKYITIDTDVLKGLTRGGTDFGRNQIENWQLYFKIKQKYFTGIKKFNFMIKTDGCGCSIILFKDIPLRPPMTDADKATIRDRKRQELLDSLPSDQNITWVGVDPGRKDLISAGWEDGSSYSFSNGKYYENCKYNKRKAHKERKIQECGLIDFLGQMPSSKTARSIDTLQYLNYLYSHNEKLQELFDLECLQSVKHHRWRTYIHKQITLDLICQHLLSTDEDKLPVIAYGDASYNHNSRGYAPTLKANWIKHRLEKIHRAKVLMVNKFNTSQVCSSCKHPEKLVGLKSNRDPAATSVTRAPVKSHFVGRCTNYLMIWNRDTNAWKNILYLGKLEAQGQERPDIFRRQLPTPPIMVGSSPIMGSMPVLL